VHKNPQPPGRAVFLIRGPYAVDGGSAPGDGDRMMKFWFLFLGLSTGRSLKTDQVGLQIQGGDELDLSAILNGQETARSDKTADSSADSSDEIPELDLPDDRSMASASTPKAVPGSFREMSRIDSSDDEIRNLERSVLNLVNQGASPGMMSFVNEVRKLLHFKMKKELLLQHSTMQKLLNVSYDAISTCSSRDWREILNVALSHDVNGSFTVESYRLPKLADEHRNCRDMQAKRMERLAELESLTDDAKAAMMATCAVYASNETERLIPVGDSNRCVMDAAKYPLNQKSRHVDYLKDQLAFWDAEYQKILDSRVQCQNATEAFKSHKVMVDKASIALRDVKQSCNEAQAKMDEASCGYKASLVKTCELIARCADNSWKSYNDTLVTAKTEEIFLKDQMNVLVRIDCYLGALQSNDMQEGVKYCKEKDFHVHPDVLGMTFLAHERPEIKECKMDKENVAGYCDYEGKYYGNTSDLSQPCNASCCSRTCHP